MLTAGITSGAGLDGHYNDAVQNGFGLLGGTHCFFVVHFAHGVAAVGNNDHYFPSLSRFERSCP